MTSLATNDILALLPPAARSVWKRGEKSDKRQRSRITLEEINQWAGDDEALLGHEAIQQDNRSKLTKFFDFIDIPRNVVANAISGVMGVKTDDKERGALGLPRVFMSDVLDHLGVDNRAVRAIAGFAGDVAVDPLTYLGGAGAMRQGAFRITRAGGMKAIKTAAREAAEGIRPRGSIGGLFSDAALEALKKTDKKVAASKAKTIIERSLKNNLTDPGQAGQAARAVAEEYGVKGRALFHIPLTDKEFVKLPMGEGVRFQSLLKQTNESLRAAEAVGDVEQKAQAVEAALEPLTRYVQWSKLPPKLIGDRIAPALEKALGKEMADLIVKPVTGLQSGIRSVFGTLEKSVAEKIHQTMYSIPLRKAEAEGAQMLGASRGLRTGKLLPGAPGSELEPILAAAQELEQAMPGTFKTPADSMEAARRIIGARTEAELFPTVEEFIQHNPEVVAARQALGEAEAFAKDAKGTLDEPVAKEAVVAAKAAVDETLEAAERFMMDESPDVFRIAGTPRVIPRDDGIRHTLGSEVYHVAFDRLDNSVAAQTARKYVADYAQLRGELKQLGLQENFLEEGYQYRVLTPEANEARKKIKEVKGSPFERILRDQATTPSKHRTTWYFTVDPMNPQAEKVWAPTSKELKELMDAHPEGQYMPVSIFEMNRMARNGEFDRFLGPEWSRYVKETGADTFLVSPTEQAVLRRLASQRAILNRRFEEWTAGTFGRWFPRESLEWLREPGEFEARRGQTVAWTRPMDIDAESAKFGKVMAVNEDGTARVRFGWIDDTGEEIAKDFDIDPQELRVWENRNVKGVEDIVLPPGMEDKWVKVHELGDLTDLGPGGRGMVLFPKEMAPDLRRVAQMYFGPAEQMGPVMDFVNKVQSVLKAQMLLGAPYPIINAVGVGMNMAAAGMGSRPTDFLRVGQAAHAMWSAAVRKGGSEALAHLKPILTDMNDTVTWRELFEQAQKRGVLNTSLVAEFQKVLHVHKLGETLKNLPYKDQSAVRKALGKVGSPIGKGIQAFFKANQFVEESSKLGLFAAMVERGHSFEDAAGIADKFMFDYTRATKTEHRLMIPTFGFYRWLRNSSALNLQMMAQNPKYAALVPKIKEAVSVDAPINDGLVSEFLEEMQSAQITGGPEGGSFLTVLNALPQMDLKTYIAPMEVGVESLAPLPSMIGSIATGRELFTGRMLGGYGEPETEKTVPQYLMDQIRVYRDFKRFMRQKGVSAKAAAVVLGGRIQDVELEKALVRKDAELTKQIRLLRGKLHRKDLSDADRADTARKVLELYQEQESFGLEIPKVAGELLEQRR